VQTIRGELADRLIFGGAVLEVRGHFSDCPHSTYAPSALTFVGCLCPLLLELCFRVASSFGLFLGSVDLL
jgi:hypothetical protein